MSEFDSSLIGQRQQRLAKLDQLRKLGIDPYPADSNKTHKNKQIHDQFDDLQGKMVSVAGRIMSWREFGQLAFADIQDASGTVQLYFKSEELSPFNSESQHLGWDQLSLLDAGDYVEAQGLVVKTESGEVSVLVSELKILVKTIRPLPSKFHGITDKEERFRRRYLDMTMNPEVMHRFERRAAFWQAHRDFFNQREFYEVNIPILEHIPGGGDAVPFTTHMNAIDEDFYLRISHELPLKRLIGAGFEKVYDIGARFRNEGLSDEHLPEHVAMEFYWAYADWRDGMKMIQELYQYIIKTVYPGKTTFKIREHEVDFSKDWEEIDFAEIMREKFGIADIYNTTIEELTPLLDQHQINYDPETINVPRATDSLWKKLRKTITGPAFLVNHPKFMSPLQKPSTENPQMVERFQPIIAGSELGNGWSEVNDAVDQYDRFVEQQEMRDSGDDEAQWLDIDYVEMLEYGMAPTFGYGHSERVFWFLEDVTAREGVPFPQLKFHISEDTKKIYPEIDFDTIRNPGADSSGHRTQDTSRKMVIVLREDLEGWQLTNTVAHISGLLGSEIGKNKLTTREEFALQGGEAIKANAQYAMIMMKAKSAEQLYNLLTKAEQQGVQSMAFVQDMINLNLDKDLQHTLGAQKKSELDYIGVGLFGTNEEISQLTKKFSLWK